MLELPLGRVAKRRGYGNGGGGSWVQRRWERDAGARDRAEQVLRPAMPLTGGG